MLSNRNNTKKIYIKIFNGWEILKKTRIENPNENVTNTK